MVTKNFRAGAPARKEPLLTVSLFLLCGLGWGGRLGDLYVNMVDCLKKVLPSRRGQKPPAGGVTRLPPRHRSEAAENHLGSDRR